MSGAVWSWSTGHFRPYDAEVSRLIEEGFCKNQQEVRIRLWTGTGHESYRINFHKMRQESLRDGHKWRPVQRTQVQPSLVTQEPVTARDAGLEVEFRGKVRSFHLTCRVAAESIIRSRTVGLLAVRARLGPFIYFAGSPEDCEGKANGVRSGKDGAVLQATVDLGHALVVGQRPSASAAAFLGISDWAELDKVKLMKAGCQSVYGKAPLVTRDEWAVPSNSQITNLTLKGYKQQGQQLPFWQWPEWVHMLADTVQVDHLAIDRLSDLARQIGGPPCPDCPDYGVRVNSAGRPIHRDGKFMSYAEARKRGWGGPTNRWSQQEDMSSDSRTKERMERTSEGNGRARLLTGTHQGGLPAFAQSKQFPQQQTHGTNIRRQWAGKVTHRHTSGRLTSLRPEQAVPTAAAVCEPGTHGTNIRRQWAGKVTHRHTSGRLTSLRPEQAVPTAAAVCEPGTHGTNTRRQWAGKATHRHTSGRLTSLYRFLAGMALACLLEAAVVA
ncbi:unnamed protein product [Effrenium voratum]|uniref:WWE domain-containing protein n=1 Tax=Effrenium voratum TaxID=2562239 RepID=A0AA36N8B6_9DINO|nr:unnamed protein product [Effrenium voratum]